MTFSAELLIYMRLHSLKIEGLRLSPSHVDHELVNVLKVY